MDEGMTERCGTPPVVREEHHLRPDHGGSSPPSKSMNPFESIVTLASENRDCKNDNADEEGQDYPANCYSRYRDLPNVCLE